MSVCLCVVVGGGRAVGAGEEERGRVGSPAQGGGCQDVGEKGEGVGEREGGQRETYE